MNTKSLRSNNLLCLRIFLSLSVVIFHTATLTDDRQLDWVRVFFNGHWAVEIFFLLSGYLIPASWIASVGYLDYFKKRILRIYPAYFLLIVVTCIFILVFSNARHIDIAGYFFSNIFYLNFLKSKIAGVFDGNFSQAINGALWTLKIEVAYYFVVPLIVYFEKLAGVYKTVLACILLSLLYRIGVEALDIQKGPELIRQLPGQLIFFAFGRLLYHYRASSGMRISAIYLLPLLFLFAAASLIYDLSVLRAFFYLLLVYFVLNLDVNFDVYLKGNDPSYAMYLVHYPLIQCALALGLFSSNYLLMLAAVVVAVTIGLLSWNFVEKPLFKYARGVSHAKQIVGV